MTEQVRSWATEIENAVSQALQAVVPAEHADADPLVRRSDFADFQSNVSLSLAKKLGRKPRDLAEDIAARLREHPGIAEVEISGPGFLNITLTHSGLLQTLAARHALPALGVREAQAGETVVIDYSAPNIAKEMHVGHVRSTLIGDSLARVLSFLGAEVIRRNHVGDWGTQFGMLVEFLLDNPDLSWRNADLTSPEGADGAAAGNAASALDALYRQAHAQFREDPDFKQRAQKRVVALQAGDEETVGVWREIVAESEQAFQRIYEKLGVLLTPDDMAGESSYNPLLSDVVAELEAKGILEESEGALCVFFDDILGPEGNRVPLLVRKSDGGFGYGATDLATIRFRLEQLKASRVLYVVDSRQSQHFDMVFRTARRAGWLTEQDVQHVGFGTITGPGGKPFKTRSGDVAKLSDLLTSAVQRAREVVAEKDPDLPADELESIAQLAGIGAVKYAELSSTRTKDYAFDVDRMVSFTGQTGVYLQYMHTRIASIQRKATQAGEDAAGARIQPGVELEPAERTLGLLLDEFPAILSTVAAELEPHRLANYLFTLAKAFSEFYEACSVLKAPTPEQRENRLALCALTRRTLATGLELLGITAPERM